jgi:hypothetical protein
MKIWLILYLWHAGHAQNGGAGGPAFTITQMPSFAACEVVGKAAKQMVDQQGALVWGGYGHVQPVTYRCVMTP